MTERVFRDASVQDNYRWIYRDGKTVIKKLGQHPKHEIDAGFSLADLTNPELFTEVLYSTPTDLPPTTADLHAELAAYKQFATAITASFGDDAKRNHQMDFQHAYDRLRAVIKEPME